MTPMGLPRIVVYPFAALLICGLGPAGFAWADVCSDAVTQVKDQAAAGRPAERWIVEEVRKSCPPDILAKVSFAIDQLAEAALDAEAEKQHQLRVDAYAKLRGQLESALSAYAEFQGLAVGAAMQAAQPVLDTKLNTQLRQQQLQQGN